MNTAILPSNQTLVLFGSPHRDGAARRLLCQVLSSPYFASAQIEEISLYDHLIRPCIGCLTCIQSGGCPWNSDGMEFLLERIDAADTILIAFPVYFSGIPAPVKAMIDRMQQRYSLRRDAFSKRGVLLTVAGSENPLANPGIEMGIRQFFRCCPADFLGTIAVEHTDSTPDFYIDPTAIAKLFARFQEGDVL